MSLRLSDQLELYRSEKKIKKGDVALSLGISVQALAKKRRGENNFTEDQLLAYAELLNLKILIVRND